jgi:RNA polymerase sigma factor for flagellar operon FliA
VSSPIDGADAIASDSPGPLDQIQAQEMKDHLREALASLPEAQRMVTTLYYIKDYKTREISEFLEVPMTTVKRRLDLARKKLKTGLQQEMRNGLARKRPSDQRELTNEIHVHITDDVMPKPPRAHGRAAREEVSEKDETEGEGQYEGKSQKEADRELWQRYHEAKDDVSRNVLIERYLPLVQLHAQRIASRLPSAVDTDDLCSGGVVGLLDAIVSFDPDRGVCFEAFSGWRIKGAMFDELRSMDWVPRLVRLRASKMANAIDRLSKQDGSLPTEEELKRELDVDADEYSKIRRDAAVVGVSSLSKQLMSNESDGKDLYEVNVLIDPSQPNPLTSAEKLDMKHTLMRGMSRSECLIIVLYYYEQMTMREIADTLDLSESRISQMHSLIIQRLKSQLNYRRGAGAECAVA